MSDHESIQDTAQLEIDQRYLDAFLVDNPELEELNARLSGFNLFDVLQVSHVEIRHSNVLAWLLTPDETHGLGALFLRRLLSRLLMEEDVSGVSLTAAKVELMPLGDIEVRREWGNIDILVIGRLHKWCLLIENKIHAKESKGQLTKYIEKVKNEFSGYQIVPVFLTLEGEDPSEDAVDAGYIGLGYNTILDLAERLVLQNINRIPEDAQIFLKHYLEVLRRLTMQDEQLVDLCKAIYRKHRKAIDLIISYGASSEVIDACTPMLKKLAKWKEMKLSKNMLWFLPTDMADVMHQVNVDGWKNLPGSYPIWCWMYYYGNESATIRMVMEVGPVGNYGLRVGLLEAIEDAGLRFSKGAKLQGSRFTRIVSVKQVLPRDRNGDIDMAEQRIEKSLKELWGKFWKKGQTIIPVLQKFDWPEQLAK